MNTLILSKARLQIHGSVPYQHKNEVLHKMNHHSEFDEDIIRKYLILLDLEETRLRKKAPEEELVK